MKKPRLHKQLDVVLTSRLHSAFKESVQSTIETFYRLATDPDAAGKTPAEILLGIAAKKEQHRTAKTHKGKGAQ